MRAIASVVCHDERRREDRQRRFENQNEKFIFCMKFSCRGSSLMAFADSSLCIDEWYDVNSNLNVEILLEVQSRSKVHQRRHFDLRQTFSSFPSRNDVHKVTSTLETLD